MMQRSSNRRGKSTVQVLVATLGGRFSLEAGIDLDAGDHEVERWFLAATLFGTRISATIVVRTYRVLTAAGLQTIDNVADRTWEELVALLDEGGYARYDFRTATRLLDLSATVADRHPEGIAAMGRASTDPGELAAVLDALPGWGPVTVNAFLRELRGVWPAAQPPLDERTEAAARHLGLVRGPPLTLAGVTELATAADTDPRDLEAALIRLDLRHRRGYRRCEESRAGGCQYVTARANRAP